MNSTPSEENPNPEDVFPLPSEEPAAEIPASVEASDEMEDIAGIGAEEPPLDLDPPTLLRAEVKKWKDVALRNQAELENFRKRMAREKSDAIKFGNAALLESLLPVLDNFQFGLNAARNESSTTGILEGMSMVLKQINDFLADNGITEVPAEGEVFDPNLHDAVQQEYHPEAAEGTITQVIRRGFRLHDRILRAPAVIVSKGLQPADESSGEEADGEPPLTETSATQ